MSIERARLALEGLSTGDAFGEQLLHAGPQARALALTHRTAPHGRVWKWTDDTAMALSIVETLAERGGIDPELLAQMFEGRCWALMPFLDRACILQHREPDGIEQLR